MTEQKVTNIHEAIVAVMGDVGYVKKEKATGLTYTFAGEAALIQALRPSMIENGIHMYARYFEIISSENYTTKNGTAMQNVKVAAKIVFSHAPSGTEIETMALGEASDSSDKSVNKAMTGAYKYALRQTFCIETGDDPDTSREERAAPAKAAPAKAEQTLPRSGTAEAAPDKKITRPYTPRQLKIAIAKGAEKVNAIDDRSYTSVEGEIGSWVAVHPTVADVNDPKDPTDIFLKFMSYFGIDAGIALADLGPDDSKAYRKIMASLDHWLFTGDPEQASFAAAEFNDLMLGLTGKKKALPRPIP